MKKLILAMALPMLKVIGAELKALDADDEGNDDLAGAAIIYAADVTEAVNNKAPIPYPPAVLLRGGKPAQVKPQDLTSTKPLEV
ncbi:MAG: hypothetical protein WBV94_09655 [Blastocatellia bacterium]